MLNQRQPLLNEPYNYLAYQHEDVRLTAVETTRDLAIRDWIGARATQQDHADALSLPGEESLCVLADGMGGVSDGQAASQAAVDAFLQSFAEQDAGPAELRLRAALDAANDAVRNSIDPHGALNGVGTTLVAAYKQQNFLFWISVGGSALWLMRDGQLHRLNEDHSLRQELATQVERGELTQAQANSHPKRQALRSALVGGPLALVDLRYIRILPQDRLLLTSEGINTLSPDELANFLSAHKHRTAAQTADRLMSAIQELAEPRQNNATVIVLDHQPKPFTQDQVSTAPVASPLPTRPATAAAKFAILLLSALGTAGALGFASIDLQAPELGPAQLPTETSRFEKVDIWGSRPPSE